MPRYAELDVTTNFSFLRGGSHAEELVATAKAHQLEAIAVTDRNTLAGVVRAHLAAKEVGGIKFIVGARLDLQDAPSLLAYPRDRAAYGRLCRLLTLGQRRAEKGQCTLFLATSRRTPMASSSSPSPLMIGRTLRDGASPLLRVRTQRLWPSPTLMPRSVRRTRLEAWSPLSNPI